MTTQQARTTQTGAADGRSAGEGSAAPAEAPRPRIGGRPPRIGVADIVAAGREIGMAELSVKAVAARLGVTPTALYRHVDGRWGLERVVGESLLAELTLPDEGRDTVTHLLSFALRLRAFLLEHPGLARYLETMFPRGEAGRALVVAEVEALRRRGYSLDAALGLQGAVAALTVSLTASEEQQRAVADADAEGLEREREAAWAVVLRADDLPGRGQLPETSTFDYTRMLLHAAIRGLVAAGPPGRPVADVLADLLGPPSGPGAATVGDRDEASPGGTTPGEAAGRQGAGERGATSAGGRDAARPAGAGQVR